MYCHKLLKISFTTNYASQYKHVKVARHTSNCLSTCFYTSAVMASHNFRNKKGEVSNLRHVKYQYRRDGRINPPGNIEAQVVSMGAHGTPRALIINMDHFKYLFNCGEGTQRISMEHRMKVSKVQEIFITRHSWENIGGLLGMCLSMESMNVPRVRIHGPPNVEKLVTMSKGFAQLHKIRVDKAELEQGYHADSAMQIDYIPLLPQPSQDQAGVCPHDSSDMAMAYLCQPHPRPQNICLEKCVDLGIPRGPVIGQLKNGQEVTLPDGRVVKPEDVLADAEPNDPFIVLECPTTHHIPALTNCDLLREIKPQLIVHMTPQAVLLSPEYQSWITSYPDTTTHLVMNENCSGLVYEGVFRIQAMLGMIHDGVFPSLPEPNVAKPEGLVPEGSNLNIVLAETNLRYSIRSKKQGEFNRDQCITLDYPAFRNSVIEQENFPEVLQATKEKLAQHQQQQQAGSRYPELLFLGTGSAIPNKVRNVSGILLNLSEDQSVLLDCGENSLGQLIRHYGNQVDDILLRLSTIFVSHLHADHHLGIISVVQERQRALQSRGLEVTPLSIVAPTRLAEWYSSLELFQLDMAKLTRVIPVEYFYQEPPEGSKEIYENFIAGLGLKQVEMVRVIHRQFPHGVVLTHQSGWKLVYSGDTMPCDNLVRAGMNCDVLIHEATMEDDLEEEAKVKKHSTTSQAIQAGLNMSAKFILLTHFSQRYAKVPLFNANFSDRVGIAFDNMRVSLSELQLIPFFLPVLKAMFADEYAEMEERTLKRSYKKVAAEGGETEQQQTTNKRQKKHKGKWNQNQKQHNFNR